MSTPAIATVVVVLILAVVSAAAGGQTSGLFGAAAGQEKVTNLHFYLHDTLGGKDPTAVLVARGAGGEQPRPGAPTPFSSLFATDDVLTEGPARQSRVVGNAQGTYVSSGKAGLSLVMGMDFELTDYADGAFDGSSFVVFSRNPVAAGDGRELAIVGGRGKFRMARGYALLRTTYLDAGNGDAIIEYNVTLLHY